MQDQIVIVVLAAALFVCVPLIQSSPVPPAGSLPPLCESGIVEEMPPHIKKVCMALENSNQLSSALNQYIRSEAAGAYRHEPSRLSLNKTQTYMNIQQFAYPQHFS